MAKNSDKFNPERKIWEQKPKYAIKLEAQNKPKKHAQINILDPKTVFLGPKISKNNAET